MGKVGFHAHCVITILNCQTIILSLFSMVATQVLQWRCHYSLWLIRDYNSPLYALTLCNSTRIRCPLHAALYIRGKDCIDVIDMIIIDTIVVYFVIDCTDELCKIVMDWQTLHSICRSRSFTKQDMFHQI